uniref:ABC transporter substrate-binding protein n=1 Tax=uncultured Aquincola sp. TaxID=886556 RepID=UPI0032B2CB49
MNIGSISASRRGFTLGLVGAALAAGSVGAWAQAKPLAGQTVKMMWIDPLSGLMGPVGTNQLKSLQFFAEKFSATNPAGVKFEVIGMDNKLSPTESLNHLKAAIDQGIRYVLQGNGSSVAIPLIDAINKHNERNPGKEIIFLNTAAVDPDLTNSKCSYWHFRYDADTSMKVEAMTSFIKGQADIKKVF